MDTRLSILKIPNLNALIIKQEEGERFFLLTDNSIIISIPNFATLINYLVREGFLDMKVLEGILSGLKE